MYKCGDQVVYGIHGVCCVTGTACKAVDKKQVEYLILEPMDQPGSKYFIPSANPAALAKLRPLIDRNSLDALLRSDAVRQNVWIEDENKRKLRYRELITGGDRQALLQMVYTLHMHKKTLLEAGRKLHLCDDGFLRDAEKLLHSEFSVALGVPQGEVVKYVTAMFDREQNA